MLTYNELYEILRKEKYSESLQPLTKKFLQDFKEYIKENKKEENNSALFPDISRTKKQFENSIALFKEIMLKRKKKILDLVFIATETGIMKKDYENMLSFEQKTFEKMIRNFEEADKELAGSLRSENEVNENKMIIFNKEVEQFVDSSGNLNGPYKAKDLANINSEIAQILVSEGKAIFVDEH